MLGGPLVRSAVVAGALVAPLTLAPAASAVVTYEAPAKPVELTGDIGLGPVALRSATVGQREGELVVRIETDAAFDATSLRAGTSPGRRICVSVFAPAETRLCLEGEGDRLRLRRAAIDASGRTDRWRTVPATIGRPSKRTVQIRAPFTTFAVEPGKVSWAVRTSWRDEDECRRSGACESRLPQLGFATYTVRRPVTLGCLASGPTVVNRGPAAGQRIALTFDDGPGPFTSGYLDTLRRHDVPATFFVLGQQVAGRQATLQRMVREGHAIGNHSWSHANLAGGGQGQLARTNDAVRAATGITPCLFRPPYGARSATLDAQVRALGMLDVLWTVDTNDWQGPGTATIARRVINGARPGAIVLMHDAGGPRGAGLAALPRIITTLKARGYRFVTVPELLGLQQPVRYR